MSLTARVLLLVIIGVIIGLIMLQGCLKEEMPEFILVFFENGWGGFYVDSFPRFKEYYGTIDAIAPFWYTMGPSGDLIMDIHREEVISFASDKDIMIIPLINNANIPGAPGKTGDMLKSYNAVEAAENIVELLKIHDYNGVNIDFEYFPAELKKEYTGFIKVLSGELKKIGKLLTVSIFPKIDFPDDAGEVFDYKAIGEYADMVVIMTYDRSRPWDEPGPVAPIKWVEDNILYAISHIPKEKILLGIAGYGYDWAQGTDRAIPLPAWKAEDRASRYGAIIRWDSEAQSPYYRYIDDEGVEHIVWYENTRSMELKRDLVGKYQLKGIALWRLGYEVEEFWFTK